MSNYIQEGYREVTPMLIAEDAAGLIDFIQKTFNATLRLQMPAPGGKVGHAELAIGGSVIMVADPDERNQRVTGGLHVYVEDCDRVFEAALEAGAIAEEQPETRFYGDRSGTVRDRWGNHWYIATHVEDVSNEEAQKRMAELMRG